MDQRMREFEAQNEMLRNLVERAYGRGETRRSAIGPESLKLTKLAETDDIEAYLTTFERLMSADTRSTQHGGRSC